VKILYLIHQFFPKYYTGTERFILNQAIMAQKSGHKVKVLTYSFYDDAFYDQSIGNIRFKEFTYQGIPVLALKHMILPDDIHYALENKDFSVVARSLIEKEAPDIIHVGHPMRVGEFIRAAIALRIPYIVTLTDFFSICPKCTLFTSSHTLCGGPSQGRACLELCPEFPMDVIVERLATTRNILDHAKVVVSPTRFLASLIQKEFPQLDIKIISHGVKYSSIKRNAKRYSKGDQIIFCYAGSLNRHKGVHLLVEAFRNARFENILLKIYGSGAEERYVAQLREMAAEDRRIWFCGIYEGGRVGDILADVDVLVIPSVWYENTPIVVREALACGVPVIGSDVGGIAEDVEDRVTGYLFNVGDSEHLTRVLKLIAKKPSLLNPIKRNIAELWISNMEQESYAYARIYALMMAGMENGVTPLLASL